MLALLSKLKQLFVPQRSTAERRPAHLSFERLEDRQLLSVGHTTSFFRAEEASSPIVDYVVPDTRALDLNRAYAALAQLDGDRLAYGFWTDEERSTHSWSDFRAVVARLQAERPELEVLVYVGSPSYAGDGSFSWGDDAGRYDDYERWSREVALLSAEFPIVKGILLDDFSADMQRDVGMNKLFTPEYVAAIRTAGRSIQKNFRVEAVYYLPAISAYDAQRFEGSLDAVHFFYRHVEGQGVDADPDRIADEIAMFQRAYSAAELSPLATVYRPSNRSARQGDLVTVEATIDLDAVRTDLVVAHFDSVAPLAGSSGWVRKTITLGDSVIYDADVADDGLEVRAITIPAAEIEALRSGGARTAKLKMTLTITQSFARWSYAANIFVRQPEDVYLDWTWSDSAESNVVVTSRDLAGPPERYLGLYGGSPSFLTVTPEYTWTVLDHARAAYAAGDVEGINVWEVMMQETNAAVFAEYEVYFAAVTADRQRELFSTGNYLENWGGSQERWIRGTEGQWYFILPTGDVFEWSGTRLEGELVASLDATYYADPERLFAAAPDPRLANLDVVGRANIASHFDERLDLHVADQVYENWGGRGEKWLLGRNRQWYFITPDGSLYEWDRQPTASGWLVANLSPTYHTHLQLLYDAHAYAIDSLYGFESVDERWTNWGGLGEKWFASGNTWYYLLPNGTLWQWHSKTATGLVGTQVAALDPSYHQDPTRLTRAQAVHLAIHLGLHSLGNIWQNWGGSREKWLLDRDRQWLFVTPDGSLYRWDGGPTATGERIALLDAAAFGDLSWLAGSAE